MCKATPFAKERGEELCIEIEGARMVSVSCFRGLVDMSTRNSNRPEKE